MDEAGRRVLAYYLDQMIAQEPGVLNDRDIEAVHDMRVACRRLRVACRLFRKAFGKKTLAPYLKRLRALARDLGAVRDLDVFLDFLAAEQADASGDAIGIEALRADLIRRRASPRAHLTAQLQSRSYDRFKQAFRSWLDDAPAKPRKAGRRYVTETAPRLLDRRRKAVAAYAPAIDAHTPAETLHALRITCKQLRYAAETFKGCYGKRLNALIARMTTLQDILGRHHDADVHIATAADYIAGLDRRSSRARRIQASLERMIESERRVQRECFERFQEVWTSVLPELDALDFGLSSPSALSK